MLGIYYLDRASPFQNSKTEVQLKSFVCNNKVFENYPVYMRGSFKMFYLLPHNFVNIKDSCMKFAMIEACNHSYTHKINSF